MDSVLLPLPGLLYAKRMRLELPPFDHVSNTPTRGAALDHLDQDGDVTFLDGGGVALAIDDKGVEDGRDHVRYVGLRVGHEVQQGRTMPASTTRSRFLRVPLQRTYNTMVASFPPPRAPSLEKEDQYRDNARAFDSGRRGIIELGQLEQCNVLPRAVVSLPPRR